jgi:quercetin dioxygenase-like cupin family protein
MTQALTNEELELLDEMVAGTIEPVAPPVEVRARVMAAVARRSRLDDSIPAEHESRTLRAHEAWRVVACPGVKMRKLSEDAARNTVTVQFELAPGAILPAHDHKGAEDSYVISGSCRIGAVALSAGDFHHVDAGAHHGDVVSDEGCMLLLVVDRTDYHAA